MPFTRLADRRLERRIESELAFLTGEIRRVVPARSLLAIVLGGGYGRGDGGMHMAPHGPLPHDDYELLVVLRGLSPFGQRSVRCTIEGRRAEWEKSIGTAVELSVVTTSKLRHAAPTLMFLDLLHGHRVLHGEISLPELMPPLGRMGLPLIEGARLLVNRGSLLARCKAAFLAEHPPQPAERALQIKYLNKAILACGDAVLIANGCYVTDYDKRKAALKDSARPSVQATHVLPEWYARAVEDRRTGYEKLPQGCMDIEDFFHSVWSMFEHVHRWFESERLGRNGLCWADYVKCHSSKFPGASWLHRWIERARNWREEFPPPYGSLSRTREDALAECLADLLYLSGRPAVDHVRPLATVDWVRRFWAYWAAWSGRPSETRNLAPNRQPLRTVLGYSCAAVPSALTGNLDPEKLECSQKS